MPGEYTMTTTAVIPDCHIPWHDVKAWALALKAIREIQPDRVVILGDFIDCLAISTFPKSPDRVHHLRYEVETGEACLDELMEAAPEAEIDFLEGNHEHRMSKYLATKAPELFGLVSIRKLLRVDERGWKWVPYRHHVTHGKIAYSHEIGHFGKQAVQQSLDSFGGNIVFGHTHRGGIAYGGTVKGEHRVAMSCGWLGDGSAVDYMHKSKTRDWQTGMGLVQQDRAGNGWLSFCPIIGGKINVQGTWVGK